MDNIEICKLEPSYWEQYKNLRLRSLQDNPEAYGLLHEEAIKYTDEEWKTPLVEANTGKEKWIYFAKLNDKLVGLISGKVIDGDTAKLGEVFVAEEARGKGIAKKILLTLLEDICRHPELKRAKVKVFTSQAAAINLYKSVGFETSETISESWPDGRTHETYIMFKDLNS